jgi:hypothetical protein
MKLEELVIPIRFDEQELDASLTIIKKKIGGGLTDVAAMGAITGLATAYLGFIKTAVEDTIEWRQKVLDMHDVLGTTAEDASQMTFLFDMMGSTIGEANMAAKALAKEGLLLDVETLGALSEQYLSIEDAAARQQFLIDNLGESGTKMRGIMELGREGINQLIERMPEALQLTGDLQIETQKLQVETGLMNANFLAFKNTIGSELIPGLADLFEWLNQIYPVVKGIVGFLYAISAPGIGQRIGDAIGGLFAGEPAAVAPPYPVSNRGRNQSYMGPSFGGDQQSFDYHQFSSILAAEIAKVTGN